MTGGPRSGHSRSGWGLDAHRLGGRPPLLLGGVAVSDVEGAVATSDGDVLAHAVADALLGASVLGDLGEWYPSDDPSSSGADSMDILARVAAAAREAGWRCSHLDVTVIAEKVRVAPHRPAIRAGLASVLDVAVDQISVKATTTDGLGLIGEGGGIAAVAVITVESLDTR